MNSLETNRQPLGGPLPGGAGLEGPGAPQRRPSERFAGFGILDVENLLISPIFHLTTYFSEDMATSAAQASLFAGNTVCMVQK